MERRQGKDHAVPERGGAPGRGGLDIVSDLGAAGSELADPEGFHRKRDHRTGIAIRETPCEEGCPFTEVSLPFSHRAGADVHRKENRHRQRRRVEEPEGHRLTLFVQLEIRVAEAQERGRRPKRKRPRAPPDSQYGTGHVAGEPAQLNPANISPANITRPKRRRLRSRLPKKRFTRSPQPGVAREALLRIPPRP